MAEFHSLFMAGKYSIADTHTHTHHIFFIHSSVDGHGESCKFWKKIFWLINREKEKIVYKLFVYTQKIPKYMHAKGELLKNETGIYQEALHSNREMKRPWCRHRFPTVDRDKVMDKEHWGSQTLAMGKLFPPWAWRDWGRKSVTWAQWGVVQGPGKPAPPYLLLFSHLLLEHWAVSFPEGLRCADQRREPPEVEQNTWRMTRTINCIPYEVCVHFIAFILIYLFNKYLFSFYNVIGTV